MKKLIMLAAILAMTLTVAAPATAQEDAPADPDTPVSGDSGDGKTNPTDCEDLKKTGADIDCDPPQDPVKDEPTSGTPDARFRDGQECERFNEQYGTEIDCSVLGGAVSGDGNDAPRNPPASRGGSSGSGAKDGSGGAASSGNDLPTLPATGGGALVFLGAGAALISCGLLARKLLVRP